MAKQRFLNNFTSTFIAAVKDAPSSGTPETELDYGVLRISDGAAGSLINPTDGDYYLLTAFKRLGSVESNIEVMRVTGVNNAIPGECRITVQRAQEGTSAKAFVAGDYLSLRITKGTAENFSQPADLATKEPVIAAPVSAPTEKYWRGDKTWSDFFADVRAATLTGLSTAANAVVAATDTVLAAIGKLQAQVSAKFDKTGGDVGGNINFTGTGRRITGDFSNGNVASRVSFQTSIANSATIVQALPNGTSVLAGFSAYNQQDPTHSGIAQMIANGSEVSFRAATAGNGFPASTFLPMTFHTGGAERMRIDTSGNALVNLSTPRVFNNGVVTPAVQVGGTGTGAAMGITRFTSTADAPARIILARSGSDTLGTDAVVPSNTNIGSVDFQGYDGSAYIVRASIRGQVEGAVGSANIPTAIVLSTGATALQDRLRIDSSGNVLVTSPAVLGYGLGAGGTVVQATSKSTDVTLNKPCGRITMHNAALAGDSSVRFIVNNTFVGDTDEISVWLSNPIRPSAYDVAVDGIGAGGFGVRLRNIAATSGSDSVVLGFAVRKGATS